MEEPKQDGFLSFLETKVTPTHADQYLHWDSNHFISAKHSVYNTLAHRAKVVSSNQPSLIKELENIKLAVQSFHFPTWPHNKPQHNFEHMHYNNSDSSSTGSQHNNNHNNNGTSSNNNNRNISMVVHIHRDWVKSLQGHATRRGYKHTSRVQTPSKHYLWHPKTRTPNFRKVGSYTDTNAYKATALWSILVRLAGHLGTGSKNNSGPHP